MKEYLIVLCGEAFAGKTTLAEKLAAFYDAKIIGRDKIYFALDNILAFEESPSDDEDHLWTDLLWPVSIEGVKNQLALGRSVVVDDNCLYFKQREELRLIAKKFDAKFRLVYLDVSSEILKARKEKNKIRKFRHDVPSSLLENNAKKFERPTSKENPITYTKNNNFDELIEQIKNLY